MKKRKRSQILSNLQRRDPAISRDIEQQLVPDVPDHQSLLSSVGHSSHVSFQGDRTRYQPSTRPSLSGSQGATSAPTGPSVTPTTGTGHLSEEESLESGR